MISKYGIFIFIYMDISQKYDGLFVKYSRINIAAAALTSPSHPDGIPFSERNERDKHPEKLISGQYFKVIAFKLYSSIFFLRTKNIFISLITSIISYTIYNNFQYINDIEDAKRIVNEIKDF